MNARKAKAIRKTIAASGLDPRQVELAPLHPVLSGRAVSQVSAKA